MNEKASFDINFGMLVHALTRGLWLILICAVVCAGIAYAYVNFFVEDIYSSTATLYIGNSTGATSYSDVNLSDFLAKDYEVIIKRRAVLDEVAAQLDSGMTTSQLRSCVTVTNVADTRILDITVSTHSRELSREIVNTICEVASDKLVSIIKVDYVSIVDYGSQPVAPSNKNLPMSMILAGILGALICIFAIVVRTLMDDKVKTPDDIEYYLEMSVIGTIPFTKDLEDSSTRSSVFGRKVFGKKKRKNN